jgi:hypothetical protein
MFAPRPLGVIGDFAPSGDSACARSFCPLRVPPSGKGSREPAFDALGGE